MCVCDNEKSMCVNDSRGHSWWFNLGSHQEVGWHQLLWLNFPSATQRFTSCTDDTLPVKLESSLPLCFLPLPLSYSLSLKLLCPGMNMSSQSHTSSHYLALNWTFRQPLSHLRAAIRLFSTPWLFTSQALRLDLIGSGLIIWLIIMWITSQSQWVNVYRLKSVLYLQWSHSPAECFYINRHVLLGPVWPVLIQIKFHSFFLFFSSLHSFNIFLNGIEMSSCVL